MITVKHLTKKYNNSTVLDDINFEINKGEIVGFLGPNGAGKTTTMRIMTGFLAPTAGSIEINGVDAIDNSIEIRKKIGYLPENNPLYLDMKVIEFLQFIAKVRNQGNDKIKKMLNVCGLEKVIYKTIGELSKGYRQRVGLAQALIHDPEILILDEPTSGLDPNQIVEIRKLIKEIGQEKTVIFSTHILSEVATLCSKVIVINDGKIVAQGTTEELLSRAHHREKIYFKVKAPKDQVLIQYNNLSEVTKIETIDQEDENIFGYEIEISGNLDFRHKVSQMAHSNNWALLELTRKKVSLEDVFQQLTK